LSKHIFIYCAPVVLVYVLREWGVRSVVRVAVQVVLPLTVLVMLPFVFTGQLGCMVRRLFPFGRGLTHAYWAPNVWALYMFADRVLSYLLGRGSPGATQGLVEVVPTAVLPQITPFICLVLVASAYAPLLWMQYHNHRKRGGLLFYLALGSWLSFSLGWHVHEKAVLMITVPFTLHYLLCGGGVMSRTCGSLRLVASVSLLPLLQGRVEHLVGWCLVILGYLFDGLVHHSIPTADECLTLFGGLYFSFLHDLLPMCRWEFLPLMVISVMCSLSMLRLLYSSCMLEKGVGKMKNE
jgi:alpha-1,3-glucosyltransferase